MNWVMCERSLSRGYITENELWSASSYTHKEPLLLFSTHVQNFTTQWFEQLNFWQASLQQNRKMCEEEAFIKVNKSLFLINSDINTIHEGIGDKICIFVQLFATFLTGIIIGFIYGWKLTLVILSVSPLLAASVAVGSIVSAGEKQIRILPLKTDWEGVNPKATWPQHLESCLSPTPLAPAPKLAELCLH